MKMKEFGPRGSVPGAPLDPPMVNFSIYGMIFYRLPQPVGVWRKSQLPFREN